MKKTLFIQIDNTPAPNEAENDYIPLDCKQINDFCSFAGDALIGDLKDNHGTPLYRLMNPIGRLLSDFEKNDKTNYDQIIAQWLDVLGEMLHNGVTQCDEKFTIHFPQQYIDWLLNNENDYYIEIGKCLQSKDGIIFLDADGVSEDIISALHIKICRFLNSRKDEIEYIVFSNERIGNTSYVVKKNRTYFETYAFLRYWQWVHILKEEQQRRIENLEDYRAFWIGKLKIGLTTKEEIEEFYNFEKSGLETEYNKENVLIRIILSFDYLNRCLSILFNNEVKDYKNLSYNDISSFLIKNKGFKVQWIKNVVRGFAAELVKETETYICKLSFVSDPDVDALNRKNTLFRIIVELKNANR